MWSLWSKIILPLFTIVFLVSCAPQNTEALGEKLPRAKTKDLITALDSLHRQSVDFFYAKLSTKYQDSSRNVSFKTSFRLNPDSAFTAMISFAALPIFQVKSTTDSLFISDKREKCYVAGDLQILKENYGVDFSFKNIEELFLGLPVDFDQEQKYFQINDPYRYLISSLPKRKLKRIDKKDELAKEIAIQYELDHTGKQLKGIEIMSVEDTTTISISIPKRAMVDGMQLPEEMLMKIQTPRQEILIELSYVKSKLNEKEELFFVIPESYVPCE